MSNIYLLLDGAMMLTDEELPVVSAAAHAVSRKPKQRVSTRSGGGGFDPVLVSQDGSVST
jgi:hypothetical protein